MNVVFRRTGERRYAVIIEREGMPPQSMDPAPGYDDHIPHDLVHYVVEAELGLVSGVYGRAEKGGGTFIGAAAFGNARERARAQKKQRKREQSLRDADEARSSDMITSERLSGICDLAWRRRNGQRPDPALWKQPEAISREDQIRIDRVVARLDALATMWSALSVGGQLAFRWPRLDVI